MVPGTGRPRCYGVVSADANADFALQGANGAQCGVKKSECALMKLGAVHCTGMQCLVALSRRADLLLRQSLEGVAHSSAV